MASASRAPHARARSPIPRPWVPEPRRSSAARARWRSSLPSPDSLRGKGVVITRPRELARGLAALVESAGGTPWLFPAIEIRDPSDPDAGRRVLARLDAFDVAVFV